MSENTLLELLKKAMKNRQDNGDFTIFTVNSLTDVSIEVETGRNYKLHTEEINNILHTELDSIKEFVDQLIPRN